MPKEIGSSKAGPSVQRYLDINEIREDLLVMKDGTLRAVILVSSINFALKSEDEQNAIIAAYVSFLNNIDFPLQIVIQSRELNIDNYLNSLKDRQKRQTNELLKIQTAEYIQYVNELIAMGKIMSKRFYIVVPYNPLSDKQKNFFTRLGELFKAATVIKMKDDIFQRRRGQLLRRVDNVISGLESMGLSAVQLDTQSIIELFYSSYNPRTAGNEKLVNIKELRIAES